MKRTLASVFTAITLLTLALPARAGILYGATGTGSGVGTLVTIDPTDGSFVAVGAINDALGNNFRVTGLAFDPNTGVLYGSANMNSPTAPRNLIRIDPTTALATVVGPYGIADQTMADLTFRPGGTLYGWLEASDDDLYTIDTLTGSASLVGDSGLGTYGSGLASNAAGTLYYAGNGTAGPLHTIDPTTGLPTTVATLSGGINDGYPISALAFDSSGTLFGVEGSFGAPAYLISIDTATGAITVRGQTIDRLDAIAFQIQAVPEPSTVVLAGIGLGMALLTLGRGKMGRKGSDEARPADPRAFAPSAAQDS